MLKTQSKGARPAHWANDSGTSFKNPWPSAGLPSWSELLQGSFPLSWYKHPRDGHKVVRDVRVVNPDWGKASLEEQGLKHDDCMIGTWLGHAGTLVELPLEGTSTTRGTKQSLWLLFDPIFSMRAGPTPYTGPERINKPPCEIADLPGCDAVLISHNHYDHLDLSTIRAVSARFPKAKYFVPLANKKWFTSTGVPEELVFELDWWQEREYSLEDFGHEASSSVEDETLLRFTSMPAQHNSGRAAIDNGSTLWCGWVVEQLLSSKDESSTSKVGRKGAIYHAGDTGYRRTATSDVTCPIFKDIGQKLGPFDLSFIPIWRGGSLSFVSYVGLRLNHNDIPSALHASPADAIAIHTDVKSRNSIGIHFGTFVGSENEANEAVVEFADARDNTGVRNIDQRMEGEHTRAGTLDIGASLAIKI